MVIIIDNWIRSSLSVEQQTILKGASKRAGILASAGSGKTRTLVHLLAEDLASGIPASGIVAFTFTEKAADELLTRIHSLAKSQLPGISLDGMYVGTIHSWCLQYLLDQSSYYNFETIDELQVNALISRFYDYLDLKTIYGKSYPKAIGNFISDLDVFYNENFSSAEVPAAIIPCITKFATLLHKNRLITFGGMIQYAIKHLSSNGPVIGLKSLYVDEYQDVNPAQVSLIKSMVGDDEKIVLVGDDLQCIYNWRGSDVKRILDVESDFQGALIYRLLTNYRSRPAIVDLANDVAKHISLRDPLKQMNSGRQNVVPTVTHWISTSSEEEQANTIADIIINFRSEGTPWNKIAILLRSVTGSGRPIVNELINRGIPVQCPILSRGGDFIQEFVLPLLDWLRTEHKEPKNELEEKNIEKKANKLWDSLRKWMPYSVTEDEFWINIQDWLVRIEGQKNEAYDVRGRFYDFLNTCGVNVESTDYNLMIGLGITSQIIRSVEEIHRRRIEQQQRRTPRGVMTEVYFAIIREQQKFGESAPIDTSNNSVLVSTVHQAKGLEWPIVIIPMLENNRFPLRQQKYESSYPEHVVERYGTHTDDERRLFYVAITRAKERLFLLDRVKQNEGKVSKFLKEQKLLDPLNLSQINLDVWKLDDQDLRESDPLPVRIGLSDILIYIECPFQFGLRRVVAIQPSIGEELGYGKGLHELIQRRLDSGRPWNSAELRNQIDENVSLHYMSEHSEMLSRKAIEKDLSRLESIGAFSRNVDSEVNVKVVLEKGIIQGTVDGIQMNEDKTVIVRDWKSNIHLRYLPRYERQLQFYSYALRSQGKKVVSADIVDVGSSVKNNQIINHIVDISEQVVNSLITTLNQALDGMASGNYLANPNTISCSCCDMYRICAERVNL